MSVRNLHHLFEPESVAVVGASNRPGSVGYAVMRNMLSGGFQGPVMPVNPSHQAVAGVLTYPSVSSLPITPEMAVICTPADVVPQLVHELAERGTRAAVVLSAGLDRPTANGRTLQQAMLDAAKPHLLRILGPNCLGLLVPHLSLNASFAHLAALPGKVALVHQSGALCTALLDWARGNNIGFSHFVSIGDSADIDFGDALNYLGGDSRAHAILLYIESIRKARKFMSAARAAARIKPVLVVKAGRVAEGVRAAVSHTGALAGTDDVYEAAFKRAGMLRVYDTGEMFDAVETLSFARKLRGDRLAVLTNGGGPGVIATDALVLGGGALAILSEETLSRLDRVLPSAWSRGNPVDIVGDASGERYAKALDILLDEPEVDAVLILHAPTALVSSTEVAERIVAMAHKKGTTRTLIASWLGGESVRAARRILGDGRIPNYDTPDGAVRAFMHIVRYGRNQELLMETPPSVPTAFEPALGVARMVVDGALAEDRSVLQEPEARALLAAYGISVVETRIAKDAEQAAKVAAELGFPVALKLLSSDVTHKADVGGVILDLDNPEAVLLAARSITERLVRFRPQASTQGFAVQAMARRPGARELIVGAVTDPVFGPVILFGEGGTAVKIIADRAVSLPPLNLKLARDLVAGTRVARLLAGYRDRPPADLAAIHLTLLKIAQLVTDIPEVAEIDVNPLLADDKGVLALDARVRIAPASVTGPERLSIRPYPKELEEWVALGGREVVLRPIRPEDEPQHKVFLDSLDPEDVRFRFFGLVRSFPHTQLARFTQIDYDREMAFIASVYEAGKAVTLGVVRAICDSDNARAEFAIVVKSSLKSRGLGRLLMEKIIRYCRERGVAVLEGEVLAENERMLGLTKNLGFKARRIPDGNAVSVQLDLGAPQQDHVIAHS